MERNGEIFEQGASYARTGAGACNVVEERTKVLLISAVNASYPADADEFIAGLSDWVHDIDSLSQIVPVKGIVGSPIEGNEIMLNELGNYGSSFPKGASPKIATYTIDANECVAKELMTYNQRQVRVQRVDANGVKWSTSTNDDTMGFLATLFTTRMQATGTEAHRILLTVYYDINNYKEELNLHATRLPLSAIPDGLLLATIEAAGDDTLRVVEACSGTGITTKYGYDWAPSMFVDDKGNIPTSITFNSDTGLLTIDPQERYRLAGANVLSAGGVLGIDSTGAYVAIYPLTPIIQREWIIAGYATWASVAHTQVYFSPTTAPKVVPTVIDGDRLTSAEDMLNQCAGVTTVEYFDASNLLTAYRMCRGCTDLTSFLPLDTEKVTNFGYTFQGCGFVIAPAVDTRSAQTMEGMYQNSPNLVGIPAYETANVTDMSVMLAACPNFADMPQIDTSSLRLAILMWAGCSSLPALPKLDFSNVTNAAGFLNDCTSLTTLGGFEGIKVSFDVSYCPLTQASLQNLADTMATVTDSPTITLGDANIAIAGDNILMQMVAKGWNVANYVPLEFKSIAYGDPLPLFVAITNRGHIYYGSDITTLTQTASGYALNEVRYSENRAEFWAVGDGVIGYTDLTDGHTWTWFEQEGNWTGVAFAGLNVVAISSDAACFFETANGETALGGVIASANSGYKSIDLLSMVTYTPPDPGDGSAVITQVIYTFAIVGDSIAGELVYNLAASNAITFNEPAAYPGIAFNKIRTLSDGSVVAVGKNSDGNAVSAKGTQPGNVIPLLGTTTDWTLASSTGWTAANSPTFGTYHGYACMRATGASYSGVYGLYSALPVLPAGTPAYVTVDVYAEGAGTITLAGRSVAITTVGAWHTVSLQITPTANTNMTVYNSSGYTGSAAVMYFKNLRVAYMSAAIAIEDAEFKDVIQSANNSGAWVIVGQENGLAVAYGAGEYIAPPLGGFNAIAGLDDAPLGTDTQTLILLASDGSLWQAYDDRFGDEDIANVGWTQVANLLTE